MDNLLSHKTKVLQLIDEATVMDISHFNLIQYLREVQQNITQSNCGHQKLIPISQKVHDSKVILWKCKVCKNVIDIETVE